MIKILFMIKTTINSDCVCTFHNAYIAHIVNAHSITVTFTSCVHLHSFELWIFLNRRFTHLFELHLFIRLCVCVSMPVCCVPHSCNFASFATIFMFSCLGWNLHTFQERVQLTVFCRFAWNDTERENANKQVNNSSTKLWFMVNY